MTSLPDFGHPGRSKTPAARKKPRVLVVDDSELIRLLLANMLMGAGYVVFTAQNGRQALERLREQSVELVVTDIFMPEMDGLRLIGALKSAQPDLPIIAMSGGSLQSDGCLQQALQLGATRTLAKPFLREEMLLAVAHVLAKHAPAPEPNLRGRS